MAFFEDLSRKVQDVAFAAAEKGKEVAAIASEKAQDAADTVKTTVAIAGAQRASQAKIAPLQGEDAPGEAECADVTEAAPAEAPVEAPAEAPAEAPVQE